MMDKDEFSVFRKCRLIQMEGSHGYFAAWILLEASFFTQLARHSSKTDECLYAKIAFAERGGNLAIGIGLCSSGQTWDLLSMLLDRNLFQSPHTS